MKKTLILTLACFLVFSSLFITFTLYSSEKTPAQKWSDAEKAIEEANDSMDALNEDLAKYRTEFSQLARNGLTALAVAFSPVDILKVLFTGTGTPNRAFELKTLMISIFVQQEALN